MTPDLKVSDELTSQERIQIGFLLAQTAGLASAALEYLSRDDLSRFIDAIEALSKAISGLGVAFKEMNQRRDRQTNMDLN